jgi:hypothetical protein
MKYAFIERNRRVWPISVQCRVLEVSVSGYHEHFVRRRHILERRHLSDEAVLVHIRAVFAENRGSLARATSNGTSASGDRCRAVQQSRIRLLSSREHNMRRVLRGVVLRHRKTQRGQVNAAKKCLTLTESNR